MEILQLKYFCDAAQTENFSVTAAKHHVPTSCVSQSVRRLEKELGCELFFRSANRISLNENGKRFYGGVQRALNALEEAKNAVGNATGEVKGEVRILTQTNRRLVTMAIERCRARYPNVSFLLNHRAEQGEEYDFTVSDVPPAGECERWRLVEEDIVLAMARTHPFVESKKLLLGDLAKERFISMSGDSSLYRITQQVCAEAGFVPQIAVCTDDPHYVRKYVEMGLGIAFVPSLSWKGQLPSNVVCRDLGLLRRITYVFASHRRYTSRAAEKFLEILLYTAKEYGGE